MLDVNAAIFYYRCLTRKGTRARAPRLTWATIRTNATRTIRSTGVTRPATKAKEPLLTSVTMPTRVTQTTRATRHRRNNRWKCGIPRERLVRPCCDCRRFADSRLNFHVPVLRFEREKDRRNSALQCTDRWCKRLRTVNKTLIK